MRGSKLLSCLLAGLALVTAACGSSGTPPRGPVPTVAAAPAGQSTAAPTGATQPAKLTHVRFGTQLVAGDVALFVAEDLGYFRREGIEFEFIPFSNASEMIPALATN
jgi:ABC-type nitrate/sulfonate/bicarbonate transport system substrate-binding protein